MRFKMSKRLRFVIGYLAMWFLFFTISKGLFLLYHYEETAQLSIATIARVFLHGFRLDLSFSAYISALPFLLVSLSFLFPFKILRPLLSGYTIVIIIFVALLCVIDLELYTAWGFRLDATPLMYLDTPGEMWASAGASPIALLLFLLLLLIVLFAFSFYKWVRPLIPTTPRPNLKLFPFFLLLSGSLIVPIRGGLQLAPLNVSDAYFSENMFANQAAMNVPWNFFNSVSRKAYDKTNPYTYMDEKVAKDMLDKYFGERESDTLDILKIPNPNILIIIWESFTAKATATLNGMEGITPRFDQLVNEGILFSNFYANADRSDKGIVSILSGYPGQPTQSIIKLPGKSSKLPMLSQHFENAGYTTSFYYGGELEFANIKSYLFNGGFDNIVGKDAFEPEDWNSKWGAHDHVVLEKLYQDLKRQPEPFFTTLFTLSSHEPFEVPIETAIKGNDEESRFLNSLYYTDQAIGDFIDLAKQEAWYDSTLIIILADHGHRLPGGSKNHEKEKFHIPMLWLGGALAISDTVIETYSSQADMAATLLEQVNIPSDDFKWSRNIFSPDYTPFAQYVFNDGFGHISADGAFTFDNISRKYIKRDSATSAFELDFAKAYLQLSYQDYLDK